jgi:hypothetical protein
MSRLPAGLLALWSLLASCVLVPRIADDRVTGLMRRQVHMVEQEHPLVTREKANPAEPRRNQRN